MMYSTFSLIESTYLLIKYEFSLYPPAAIFYYLIRFLESQVKVHGQTGQLTHHRAKSAPS